jgi:hypothetical protein
VREILLLALLAGGCGGGEVTGAGDTADEEAVRRSRENRHPRNDPSPPADMGEASDLAKNPDSGQ